MRPGAGIGWLAVAVILAAAAVADPASAQQVRRVGGAEAELDARIERALASGRYRALMRDTLLAAGDTLRGPVLVLNRSVYVEGVVAGDLIGVDANLFLRPSARVTGDVVNVGGGYYPSALATVEGDVIDRPTAPYAVEEHPEVWIIVGVAERQERLDLDGVYGFDVPTYDRVNGLILDWGATYRLPEAAGVEPEVHGWVGGATERGEILGGGEAAVSSGATRVFAGGDRAVHTNQEWIRGALRNSVSYAFKGKDHRDYYQAERVYAGAARTLPLGGRSTLDLSARWQLEDATSLEADDPWSVLSQDDVRPNLPVSDGSIGSAILDLTSFWVGTTAALESTLALEVAAPALGGDFDFLRYRFSGEWSMRALADHALEVEWMLMGPVGSDEILPLQRWSFVGGSGTLNTFDIASFHGDRVAFVESEYTIPLPERFALPVVGPPELRLLHAAGMAWTALQDRDLEQNVGARLDFGVGYLRLLFDPERPGSPDFDVGLSWPFGNGYEWEK